MASSPNWPVGWQPDDRVFENLPEAIFAAFVQFVS
jgi:hypothetical protein